MILITNNDIDALERETDLRFDEARRQALINCSDVQACPGSGKTTLIAAKLILLSKRWEEQYRGVCVLSHTNVAKDEIIHRLEKHAHGWKLLRYPHFIGTIQEFVNKFLGIPYCRSLGIPVNYIDNEACITFLSRKLDYRTKSYLKNRFASVEGLQYRYENDNLILKVPAFCNPSPSLSYRDLIHKKKLLRENGYHFYREMYEYGRAFIRQSPEIIDTLRYRFPNVFIDEMQDTNLFQDEIVNSIFNDCSCQLQRFGDPDQAIFDGDEAPNTSYNNAEHEIINTSHRFCPSIAHLAAGLSHNGLNIGSSHPNTYNLPHTLFLVDQQSRESVITAFAELCGIHLSSDYTGNIKVVGAIGAQKPEGLTIRHYCPTFEKANSQKDFRPSKFIHYFTNIYSEKSWHSGKVYKSVIEGIVRCARLSDKKLAMKDGSKRMYTVDAIKQQLKDSGSLQEFNTQYLKILESKPLHESFWKTECERLLELVNLKELSGDALSFIRFEPPQTPPQSYANNQFNSLTISTTAGLVNLEVATIHSVKGETHAATLVLETKFARSYDLYSVLTYLLKISKERVIAVQKKKFMKQLYVAMTRPKYLLCMAMDVSRITSEQKQLAEALGWNVVELK